MTILVYENSFKISEDASFRIYKVSKFCYKVIKFLKFWLGLFDHFGQFQLQPMLNVPGHFIHSYPCYNRSSLFTKRIQETMQRNNFRMLRKKVEFFHHFWNKRVNEIFNQVHIKFLTSLALKLVHVLIKTSRCNRQQLGYVHIVWQTPRYTRSFELRVSSRTQNYYYPSTLRTREISAS